MRGRDRIGSGEEDNGGPTKRRVGVGNGKEDNCELREEESNTRTAGIRGTIFGLGSTMAGAGFSEPRFGSKAQSLSPK